MAPIPQRPPSGALGMYQPGRPMLPPQLGPMGAGLQSVLRDRGFQMPPPQQMQQFAGTPQMRPQQPMGQGMGFGQPQQPPSMMQTQGPASLPPGYGQRPQMGAGMGFGQPGGQMQAFGQPMGQGYGGGQPPRPY